MKDKIRPSRRTFLKQAGALSLSAAPLTFIKPELVWGTTFNSALTVGVLGPGRRGVYDASLFNRSSEAKVVALCDIYPNQIEEAKKELQLENPKVFKNYQDLLGEDLDIILITTPPYLHPEHFEAAVKANRHIFLEKPVAVDAAGCRRVIDAARHVSRGKGVTVGFQQRYGPVYLEAFKRVQEGAIGEIKMVRSAWLGGDLPRRRGNFSSEEEKVRNWLFYRELSGDIIVEQNCHNFDVVNWFLASHPLKACGMGGRVVRTDIGDVMDHLGVTFEYPNGIHVSHSANQFCQGGFSHVGEQFIGTKGAIETSRGKMTLYDGSKEPLVIKSTRDITQDAVEQFIAGIKKGTPENAAARSAESTLAAILGRTAIYSRREKRWEEVMKMDQFFIS